MIAVIATGGKQYLIQPKQKIQIEKLAGDTGATIKFDRVLLVAEETGATVDIGTPDVSHIVAGQVDKQFRTDKIVVQKYKNKTGYHRKFGHRQEMTAVTITKID